MTDWPPRPPPPTLVIRLYNSLLFLPRRIAMQPSLHDAQHIVQICSKRPEISPA